MFNPLLRFLFVYTTNWDYRKDIAGALKNAFRMVSIKTFNGGSIFIAVAEK